MGLSWDEAVAEVTGPEGRFALAEDQLFRVLELMPEDPESHALMGRLRQTQAEDEQDPDRLAALL